jgi:threonine synthase
VQRLGYDPNVERQTWANIRTLCQALHWQMLVTARAFSPHAMEGAKTIAYEICEQSGGQAPDVVYIPVGGGGLCSVCWKGFSEWQRAGHMQGSPRIVAVQPVGCDSIAQALREQRALQPIPTCESSISGLQLTAPPDGELVLRALHESQGWAVSVPDEEVYRAQADLARREGLFVEPAAAITLAAVRADVQQGRLRGHECVVCLLTGIGFKDTSAVQRMTADRTITPIRADEIPELVRGSRGRTFSR